MRRVPIRRRRRLLQRKKGPVPAAGRRPTPNHPVVGIYRRPITQAPPTRVLEPWYPGLLLYYYFISAGVSLLSFQHGVLGNGRTSAHTPHTHTQQTHTKHTRRACNGVDLEVIISRIIRSGVYSIRSQTNPPPSLPSSVEDSIQRWEHL